MNEIISGPDNNDDDGGKLLQMVQAVAIGPEDATAVVAQMEKRIREKHKHASDEKIRSLLANSLVKRYSRFAATVGGTTGLIGVVPGIGTIAAATAGASADIVACMKIQVDMCMCLCRAYGYDLTLPDTQYLVFLVSAGGAIEKAGVAGATRIGSKAGVKMVQQYLKGGALVAVKQFFKKIGITFTRKALEKAIPFGVGCVVGAGANYALTKFVGRQANKWFVLDAEMKAQGEGLE